MFLSERYSRYFFFHLKVNEKRTFYTTVNNTVVKTAYLDRN